MATRPTSRTHRPIHRMVKASEVTGVGVNIDQLSAYEAAYDTTRLLHIYFPEAFAALVADKPVTNATIAKAMTLFLRLASENLIDIHLGALEEIPHVGDIIFTPNPLDIIEHDDTNWNITPEEIGLLAAWIENPMPLMYGINDDIHINNLLAVTLYYLVEETQFSRYLGMASSWIKNLPERWHNYLKKLKQFEDGVDITCLYTCTWSTELDGWGDNWYIGELVAYILKDTHNEFADYHIYEIETEDSFENVFYNELAVYEIRDRQRDAQRLQDVYIELNRAILDQTDLLDAIVDALHEHMDICTRDYKPRSNRLVDLLSHIGYTEEKEETFAIDYLA